MICLLDTSHDLGVCSAELGEDVGQLLTPLTRYILREPSRPWAIDNGAFSGFDRKSFLSLLDREFERRESCLFVALPDVVGSAIRTLECFAHWRPIIPKGYKVALVAQDGQESLPIPWVEIDAVFIGGSTQWKISQHAEKIIRCAQVMGRWTHVGRVNDPARFEHFEQIGVDSIDGTGLARYSHMREAIAKRDHQKELSLCAQS